MNDRQTQDQPRCEKCHADVVADLLLCPVCGACWKSGYKTPTEISAAGFDTACRKRVACPVCGQGFYCNELELKTLAECPLCRQVISRTTWTGVQRVSMTVGFILSLALWAGAVWLFFAEQFPAASVIAMVASYFIYTAGNYWKQVY